MLVKGGGWERRGKPTGGENEENEDGGIEDICHFLGASKVSFSLSSSTARSFRSNLKVLESSRTNKRK